MYEELKLFLTRVKSTPAALQKLAIDANTIDELAATLNVPAKHIWTEVTTNKAVLDSYKKYGTVFNNNTDGFIDRPTCVTLADDGLIYVTSRYTDISIFNPSLLPAGKFGIRSNDQAHANAYWTAEDVAVDTTGGVLYVASRYAHTVKALDLDTGDLIWSFGVHGSPGNASDGKLNQPSGVTIAPNGNVIVTSVYGQPDNSAEYNAYGFIAELDKTTGNLVSTPLASREDPKFRRPWLGSVYVPVRAKVLVDGLLYIPYPNDDIVAVFDPSDNYKYIREYRKPHGFTVSNLGPNHVTMDTVNNEIIITCYRANLVVGLDIATGGYKWHTGVPGWDDRSDPEELPGEFNGPTATVVLDNGDLLVTDYGNNRIQLLPRTPYATVPVNVSIPNDYRVADHSIPGELDLTNMTFSMDLKLVKQAESFRLILEKLP